MNEKNMTPEQINDYISYLRAINIKSANTKLNLSYMRSRSVYYDKIPSTYEYYRTFINDILTNIRKGNHDYAYHLYQIKDLLQFEPDLHVEYKDDLFEVYL